MNQNAIDAPAYRIHYDSLAQWKVERGTDLLNNAWGPVVLLFFPVVGWLVFLVCLPFSLYYRHKAKEMIKTGRQEGGKGRPYIAPANPFIGTADNYERRIDAGVRRYHASEYPPQSLRTLRNRREFDKYAHPKQRQFDEGYDWLKGLSDISA